MTVGACDFRQRQGEDNYVTADQNLIGLLVIVLVIRCWLRRCRRHQRLNLSENRTSSAQKPAAPQVAEQTDLGMAAH
jgi:hypothetical protein